MWRCKLLFPHFLPKPPQLWVIINIMFAYLSKFKDYFPIFIFKLLKSKNIA